MSEPSFRELMGEERAVGFDQVGITVASAESIRSWSNGEVKNPETINYRTFKPEKGGLFCERIFGPTRDWECSCGKYKRIKHKGVICDRCGVEVTLARVRRERMGHIELAVPVSHIWFYKCMPSRIGLMLDMSSRQLERVIYYEDYLVIDPGQTPLQKCQLLTEVEYREALDQYGETFNAGMGAEAIKALLSGCELATLQKELDEAMGTTRSKQIRKKLAKRLKLVQGFANSHTRPEWMILDVLPVIPPDLRPLVPLEGGRFATSDLNDLYRRVINRNNRLKNLLQLKTPDVIIRNEKRMLQEAVDALFDNGRHGRAVTGAGNRPLKSLSDMLKGKGGRFRQNLLGKRVDYSGRSVIVIGPELKLHQCGLPKKMALVLFEPFIIRRLKELGYVHTVRSAKKMIERQTPEVWDILEEVTKGHPVLLNRAPTLHRLSIQAFEPQLIEGEAIRIHPLVCTAYNADFDGDQMAVHVPLSVEAQMESRMLMLASNNIFSPSSGKPVTTPSQDIVLGCYYLSQNPRKLQGQKEPDRLPLFANPTEVEFAMAEGSVRAHDRIRYKNPDIGKDTVYGDKTAKVIETTAGRVIFNQIWPEGVGFFNKACGKKQISDIIFRTYQKAGHQATVEMLDRLKEMGFTWATKAGVSIGIIDMIIPKEKHVELENAYKQIAVVEKQYRSGIITDGERYNKIIDIWTHAGDEISNVMFRTLEHNEGRKELNPVYLMVDSGARGNRQQVKQLAGMRGLMAKPSGEIIERPITSNFREGLNVMEYFISTHGARKGLADTALKTADSGYLTRKLVDASQDVIINEDDCGTTQGIVVRPIYEGDEEVVDLATRIIGRVSCETVKDPVTSSTVLKRNHLIDEATSQAVEKVGVEQLKIRSVLTCESKRGVCAKCYGRNLATGQMVKLGEAVGIIAAQSIGEPGTQLTMRTFHIGGVASGTFKVPVVKAKNDGEIRFNDLKAVQNTESQWVVLNKNGSVTIHAKDGRELERYQIVVGSTISIADGGHVKKGETFVQWDPHNVPILTEKSGKVEFRDMIAGVTVKQEIDPETGVKGTVVIEHKEDLHPQIVVVDEKTKEIISSYSIPAGAHVAVVEGKKVLAGQLLAKTPRKQAKTKDITGGLPRVAELFEARRPKDAAEIAKIDGIVEIGGAVRAKRKIIVTDPETGAEEEHLVPLAKHIIVTKGDFVKKGQQLTDGPVPPHDILDVCGPQALQEHMVNEVQEVYRLQGVEIADKHIEIIVRQMLRKVKITEPGDTGLLWGDQVDRLTFEKENAAVEEKGGKPAEAVPVLLGITKASLETDSFISAASFQDTTRVLTEAATLGRIDHLRGFKENVIMGHLIPAGTGFPAHRDIKIVNLGDHLGDAEPAPTELEPALG
ncbi:DNA-directed RNA polymerase subunit beta' [Chthoniobacter flavus]|uniref:DNA-directed RNA polymerase subunit beta' n=1 Tax=Chthoniobacter flavus TaxID=191863 RepID=UPI0010EB0C22|nr:DNA-directed RNA polymerase subunit beta' [Chthoniobacter flavus]TCO93389.1 DNA-directed RNA polymerase subunit beta' [Chthoniobacter flavus]